MLMTTSGFSLTPGVCLWHSFVVVNDDVDDMTGLTQLNRFSVNLWVEVVSANRIFKCLVTRGGS